MWIGWNRLTCVSFSTPCRERHLRCMACPQANEKSPSVNSGLTTTGDRAKPKCSSCRRSRYPLSCDYQPPTLRFRHSTLSVDSSGEDLGPWKNTGAAHNSITPSVNQQQLGGHKMPGLVFPNNAIPRTNDNSMSEDHGSVSPEPGPARTPESDDGGYFSPSGCTSSSAALDSLPSNPCGLRVESSTVAAVSPDSNRSPCVNNWVELHNSTPLPPLHRQPASDPSTPDSYADTGFRRVISDSTDERVFSFYITHVGYWVR